MLAAVILPLSCDEPTLEASLQLARAAGLVACAPRTNRPRDRRIGFFPAGRIPAAWGRFFMRDNAAAQPTAKAAHRRTD